MKGGLQGELDLKTSGPEYGKWETPIRQEPGNWEKTPGWTAGGLPGWSGMSDIQALNGGALLMYFCGEKQHDLT